MNNRDKCDEHAREVMPIVIAIVMPMTEAVRMFVQHIWEKHSTVAAEFDSHLTRISINSDLYFVFTRLKVYRYAVCCSFLSKQVFSNHEKYLEMIWKYSCWYSMAHHLRSILSLLVEKWNAIKTNLLEWNNLRCCRWPSGISCWIWPSISPFSVIAESWIEMKGTANAIEIEALNKVIQLNCMICPIPNSKIEKSS